MLHLQWKDTVVGDDFASILLDFSLGVLRCTSVPFKFIFRSLWFTWYIPNQAVVLYSILNLHRDSLNETKLFLPWPSLDQTTKHLDSINSVLVPH